MSCCGRRHNPAVGLAPAAWPAASPPPVTPATVTIRYRGRARILVRGPATGHPYIFSMERPVLAVTARDAALMLQTPQFVRE